MIKLPIKTTVSVVSVITPPCPPVRNYAGHSWFCHFHVTLVIFSNRVLGDLDSISCWICLELYFINSCRLNESDEDKIDALLLYNISYVGRLSVCVRVCVCVCLCVFLCFHFCFYPIINLNCERTDQAQTWWSDRVNPYFDPPKNS